MFGSLILDVVVMGFIMILVMKCLGYKVWFVGVVEVVVFMGGSVMLLIMGLVVFIMVEYLGILYNVIVFVVFIFVLLYYMGVFI